LDADPADQRVNFPRRSTLKHLMRAAELRTVEATWRKLGALLNLLSPAECANYLANSGYASS
jgi:hypothetical protein